MRHEGSYEITIISEPKGSNPGGWSLLEYRGRTIEAYVKYVHGSRLDSSFLLYPHQPVYEAIALEMARGLCLDVPDYFIIDNRDHSVSFTYREKQKKELRDDMPFYLASVGLPKGGAFHRAGEHGFSDLENELMVSQRFTRDLLLISDIEGRGQNYRFNSQDLNLCYIDIGCSLVKAVEGFMMPATGFKVDDYRPMGRKEDRTLQKELKSWHFQSLHCEDMSLYDVVEMVGQVKISVGENGKRVPVTELLNEEEIEHLQFIVMRGLEKNILRNRDYKDSGMIYRVHQQHDTE